MNAAGLAVADVALVAGLFAAVAVIFLLLGWRLGVQTGGSHPFEAGPPPREAAPDGEDDPWSAAMLGRDGPTAASGPDGRSRGGAAGGSRPG